MILLMACISILSEWYLSRGEKRKKVEEEVKEKAGYYFLWYFFPTFYVSMYNLFIDN